MLPQKRLRLHASPDRIGSSSVGAGQVAAHSSLQPPTVPQECDCLVKLMGGFVARQGASTGEQVCADDVIVLHAR